MLKSALICMVLATPLCGESPPKQVERSDETKAVDNVPAARDGVPAANKKLNALKKDLDKTASSRENVIDEKVNR